MPIIHPISVLTYSDGHKATPVRWCPTEVRKDGQPTRVCRFGEGHPQPCEMVRADGVGESAIRVTEAKS